MAAFANIYIRIAECRI